MCGLRFGSGWLYWDYTFCRFGMLPVLCSSHRSTLSVPRNWSRLLGHSCRSYHSTGKAWSKRTVSEQPLLARGCDPNLCLATGLDHGPSRGPDHGRDASLGLLSRSAAVQILGLFRDHHVAEPVL